MPPVVIAAGIGAAAGIGGAVLGGKSQKKAAKTAAAAQTANTNANNALQLDIYNRNTANFQPYMQTGTAAMGDLNSLLRGDSAAFDKFRDSTNYQFQLGEGLRGVNQGFAGIGALNSGAAMRSLNNYAQGQAGNALGSYTNLLQGQQNLGFGGAQALAGVSNNYGNNVTANNNNAADALSNSALLQGQANANMYGGIGGALGGLAGSFASSFGGGGNGGSKPGGFNAWTPNGGIGW
jgi:hypothetical protein